MAGLNASIPILKQGLFVPWKWDGIVNNEIISGQREPLAWPFEMEDAEKTQTDIQPQSPESIDSSEWNEGSGAVSSSPSMGQYDSVGGTDTGSPSTAATSFRMEASIGNLAPVLGKVDSPSPLRESKLPGAGQVGAVSFCPFLALTSVYI